MNLIKLANRLQHHIKSKDLDKIFNTLKEDKDLLEIFKRLDGNQIIKLCYLIWGLKNNIDPQEVSNLVDVELFAFSIVEFNEYDPEISCNNCNGRGRETCGDCSGSGSNTCGNCDGSGYLESYSDEEEKQVCDYCDGDGDVSCDYCSGNGEVDCSECGGVGTFETEDHTEFDISFFVSFNNDLKGKLELISDTSIPISGELYSKIVNNSLLFMKDKYLADDHLYETSRIDKKYRGETYLNKFVDIMDYEIKKYGKTIRIDDIDDLNDQFYK